MIAISRKECLEKIAKKVESKELLEINKHNYSDYILEVLANNDRQLADRLAYTKFSNTAVERLVKAYDTNIITYSDLLHITNYSLVSPGSERFFDDYFSSIAAGLDTKTASRILVASKFEDWSYNEIYDLVKSGTYTVSDRTFVELSADVAREMDKLGIELYAYDKDNDFYLVKDVETAIKQGDAITFSKCALAVKINEMRNRSDWNDFRDYIAEDMENIETLSYDSLVNAYHDYRIEEMNIELSRTVDKNFSDFIEDIRTAGVDEAIARCYEITVKNNIQAFVESEPANLTEEQYESLLTRQNPLDEIYNEWLQHDGLSTYSDITQAMEYTADAIRESLEREKSKTAELTVKYGRNKR